MFTQLLLRQKRAGRRSINGLIGMFDGLWHSSKTADANTGPGDQMDRIIRGHQVNN